MLHYLHALLRPAIAAACLAGIALPAWAAIRLPAVLSHHMVLQRAATVPIWGWATPGDTVTVRFGAQQASTRAGQDGAWRVTLDLTRAPATPEQLTVADREHSVTVDDVLVGEVWLASGQSNMEMHLGVEKELKRVRDADAEIARAARPTLRLFKVPRKRASEPQSDLKGEWVVCSPQSIVASKFSAAAYFFGVRLQERLNAPVGLIDASYGGTHIDYWLPGEPSTAADDKSLRARLFNAMVAPLAPFALKGVLWYQGESNVLEHEDIPAYAAKMEGLIVGWRALWKAPLPFYYVQLAPHHYSVYRRTRVIDPQALPRMREAQAAVLKVPHTGMVVSTDLVDDLADVHPVDKQSIGLRLANLALRQTYGFKDVAAFGPVFSSMRVENGKAIVSFEHGAGLATRDGKPPGWFDLAGADGHYFNADARLAGDTVVLASKYVPAPVAVRFAWGEAAQPNLFNGNGLPAQPFRAQLPGH